MRPQARFHVGCLTCLPSGHTARVLTPLEVTAGVGLLAAVLAFTGALLALRQRARADRHAAWWARAQWAIDLSFSLDPEARLVGFEAMTVLARDTTATVADLEVLKVAFGRGLGLGLDTS